MLASTSLTTRQFTMSRMSPRYSTLLGNMSPFSFARYHVCGACKMAALFQGQAKVVMVFSNSYVAAFVAAYCRLAAVL